MDTANRADNILGRAKTSINDIIGNIRSSRPVMLASDFLEHAEFAVRNPYSIATIGIFAAGGLANEAQAQHKVSGAVMAREDSAGVAILEPRDDLDIFVYDHEGDLLDMTETFRNGAWSEFLAEWSFTQVGTNEEIPLSDRCSMEIHGANPVLNEVEFKSGAISGRNEVTIYNTLGQEVAKIRRGKNVNLSAGLYFARNETDGCSSTSTFVVANGQDVRFNITDGVNINSGGSLGKTGGIGHPSDSIYISIAGEEFGFHKEGNELDVGNLYLGLDEGEYAIDELAEVPFRAFSFSNGIRDEEIDMSTQVNQSGGLDLKVGGKVIGTVYKIPDIARNDRITGIEMSLDAGKINNIEVAAFANHPYETSVQLGDGAITNFAKRDGILPAVGPIADGTGPNTPDPDTTQGLAEITGRLMMVSQQEDAYSFNELADAKVTIRDKDRNPLGIGITEMVTSDKSDAQYAVFSTSVNNTSGLDSFFVYVDPTVQAGDEEIFGYSVDHDDTGLQDISNIFVRVPDGYRVVDRSANVPVSTRSLSTGKVLDTKVEVMDGGLSITGDQNIQAWVYHKPSSERADWADRVELQTPEGHDYEICLFEDTQWETCAGRGSGATTDFTTTSLPALVTEANYVVRD